MYVLEIHPHHMVFDLLLRANMKGEEKGGATNQTLQASMSWKGNYQALLHKNVGPAECR